MRLLLYFVLIVILLSVLALLVLGILMVWNKVENKVDAGFIICLILIVCSSSGLLLSIKIHHLILTQLENE